MAEIFGTDPLGALGAAAQGGGRILGGAAQGAGRLLGGLGKRLGSPIEGTDPSSGAGSNATLRILDTIAQIGGAGSPIEAMVEKRREQAQQRKSDFVDNLQVLAKIGDFLDTVPIQERAQRTQELRKQFEADFGGENSGRLFDAVHGDPDNALGILAQMKEDPELNQLIEQGGSFDELDAVRKSPQFQERAQTRQDELLLPEIERKIQGILASPVPAVRERLAAVVRDERITVDEIRQLNEVAGQGPEGFQLTPAELRSLDRQQSAIAQRIEGFTTSKELASQREDERSFETFAREEGLKQRNKLALEKAKGSGIPKPPSETAQLNLATKTDKVRRTYRETAKQVRRAVESPLTGTGDIQALYQFIARQDDTAAREGELKLAQRAVSALGRLRRISGNITDGRLLDNDQRVQMKGILQEMLSDTEDLEREYVQRTARVAQQFGIDPNKIIPDLSDFQGGVTVGPSGQNVESITTLPEASEIRERFQAGEITREQANQQLELLRGQ